MELSMNPHAAPLILVTTAGKVGAEASSILARRGVRPAIPRQELNVIASAVRARAQHVVKIDRTPRLKPAITTHEQEEISWRP
jgi:hypothetical protein